MPDTPLNPEALVSLIEQVQEAIDHVHLDPREFFDLSDVLYHLKALAQPVVSYVPDTHALRKAVEAVHNETCGAHGDLAHIAVNAYVHALHTAQPEVTKRQELRALPVGTLIKDGEGQLMRVIGTYGSGRSKFEAVEEDWVCDDRSIPLPARVLYRPSGGGLDGH